MRRVRLSLFNGRDAKKPHLPEVSKVDRKLKRKKTNNWLYFRYLEYF